MTTRQYDEKINSLLAQECRLRVAGSHNAADRVEAERRNLWFQRIDSKN